MTELTCKPEPELDLPSYSERGEILVKISAADKDYDREIEVLTHTGSAFWLSEGMGIEYWIQEQINEQQLEQDGYWVITGVYGVYHRGIWGYDDDTEEWFYEGVRPATQEEIDGECLYRKEGDAA